MRQNLCTIYVCLIFHLNVFCHNTKTGDSAPLTNRALPPEDAAVHKGKGRDCWSSKHCRIGNFTPWTDCALRSNNNIWADLRSRINFSRFMNNHITFYVVSRCQHGWICFSLRQKIQCLSWQVIMWLTNIHPVSWQNHLKDLSFFSHLWEDFSFNRSGSIFNSINNWSVKQVETSVDLVADVNLWLLNETFDFIVFISYNNTILWWILNLSDHDGSFFSMWFMEFNQLVQWIIANNIWVKHKAETFWIIFQYQLLCKSDRTSSSQRFIL